MSKRGQVFILAAILLAVVLFSLAAIRNKSEQRQIKGDFEALSENYQIEASKLINSAIKQPGINPHEAFKSFSTMFTSYAKGKNPEYGLIYILSFEDKIQVTNFLDRGIIIRGCGAGGAEYSVSIPGGFDSINANLNFEGFNIETGIVPIDLRFDCENVTSLSGDNPVSVPCAFLYLGEGVVETDLAVMIDNAPYKSCIKKGVPEIMQVGIMKQGEQAKVSATGSCISEDFCEGLNAGQCGTCGLDVCFWWQTTCPPPYDGLCLNKYAYPNRDPVSGACPATTCNPLCIGDRIFYTDDCGNPIGTSIENCEEEQKVCRNAQCCTKLVTKSCCGDDICWFSDCNPPTPEGSESCEAGKGCRGADAKCCDLKASARCDGNKVYYYSDCNTREGLIYDCTSEGKVCKDKSDGLDKAKCCIQNYELKCDGNKIYYYSNCGTKEGLKEDCSEKGKTCEDGKCVEGEKQFKCKKSGYYVRGVDGEYECNDQEEYNRYCQEKYGSEATGTYYDYDDDDEECTVLCYYPQWTECDKNPKCGKDEEKLDERACVT